MVGEASGAGLLEPGLPGLADGLALSLVLRPGWVRKTASPSWAWSDTRLADRETGAQDIFGARVALSQGHLLGRHPHRLSVALGLVGLALLVMAARRGPNPQR